MENNNLGPSSNTVALFMGIIGSIVAVRFYQDGCVHTGHNPPICGPGAVWVFILLETLCSLSVFFWFLAWYRRR